MLNFDRLLFEKTVFRLFALFCVLIGSCCFVYVQLIVNLVDMNDNYPTFPLSQYIVPGIAETVAVGTDIIQGLLAFTSFVVYFYTYIKVYYNSAEKNEIQNRACGW